MHRVLTALALIAAATAAGCGGDPAPTPATATATAAPTPRSISVEEIEALAHARARERTEARRHRERALRAAAAPVVRVATPPPITPAYIPFDATRRREMAAYARRHYGLDSHRLSEPRVIVEHFTATADADGAIALFAPDTPDPELGELPNVCAHYVIDTDGTIDAVVPVEIMCRHTVGLNYTAIGIEHAGFSAAEILGNDAQMRSSIALTRWLQCRFAIGDADVIGHNESLSSPWHRERVAALRTQTHDDFNRAEMDVYRQRLAADAESC